jgi:alkaline phosphatase
LPKYISFIGMKIKLQLALLAVAAFSAGNVNAQAKYTHSHNDYANNTPFYKAFTNGYNSIEADIFLVDGELLVSHSEKALFKERTLKGMYLDPIAYALRRDTTRQLCLLIDIKDDYTKTLPKLEKELKTLQTYLLSRDNLKGRLKILISGNRPQVADFQKYSSIFWFDDDLVYPHEPAQWARIGQVSLNFEKWSKWKGVGAIPEADMKRLKKTVDSVHVNTGKLVRFWGAPDTQEAWETQIGFGADIIGTDKIEQLAGFLEKKALRKPVTAAIPNKQ